jgi:hypothetical protein
MTIEDYIEDALDIVIGRQVPEAAISSSVFSAQPHSPVAGAPGSLGPVDAGIGIMSREM